MKAEKKIKLLTILVGLAMGGAEHMAYELIRSIDRSTFEPIVLCTGIKLNTPLEAEMEKICQVEYFGHKGKITPLAMLSIMRKISSINPDIVHAHMGGVSFAIPWTGIHNRPLVITVHTEPEKAFSKNNEKQVRRALKRKNFRLVAVSKDNYEKVSEYYAIKDRRICLINNGINLGRYKRDKHQGFAFINVARQDENKNQAAIMRAFERIHARYSETKLYLIGDGPCHGELIRERDEKNLQEAVIIPGQTSKPEMFYALADVYVQSSHREAMPLSVLEAMAAGLPIISTDVGGLKDVVCENGFLVMDNNDELLYDAMLLILNQGAEAYKLMSEKSKEIAANYSSEVMANQYVDLYRSII